MTTTLSFARLSPVGRLALALSNLDRQTATRDVTVELDDDDNVFITFESTSTTGRLVEAIIDLVDERAEMRERAAS